MGKIQEAQENIKKAKENLKSITTVGESGAGMVKATVNGHREVISIEMDESLVSKEDIQMLQDLIIAATNKALQDIEVKIQDEMRKSTSGMLPNIPGMDLSSLF